MASRGNILIADESALFALLHTDWADRIEAGRAYVDPLQNCASSMRDLSAFNTSHPLFGSPPVSLLVRGSTGRRFNAGIRSRAMSAKVPEGSWFQLRDGLYMATPELVYARMASLASESRLAQIGMDLCARYHLSTSDDDIHRRKRFLTTPEKLRSYVESIENPRGQRRALQALRWVLPNSGSPEETRMKLVYCNPLSHGGLALPFKHMNYDVMAGRLEGILEQSKFSLDMADPDSKKALEYDSGEKYHPDASKDKRRRNELKALGWDVFPIDKSVLYDPDATVRVGLQVAKSMGIRIRRSSNWEAKYLQLRADIGLPC